MVVLCVFSGGGGCEIFIFNIVIVVMCDLVHDVEIIFHLR